jgi:hypothetical protein
MCAPQSTKGGRTLLPLIWITLGASVGLGLRLVVRRRLPGGAGAALLCGMAGGFVGGGFPYVLAGLGPEGPDWASGRVVASAASAVVGAALTIGLLQLAARGHSGTRERRRPG